MPVEYRDEVWVVVLIVLASIGLFIAVALWIYTLFKIYSMGIKTRNLWLSQICVIFILLSYGTCFAFVPVPNFSSCAVIRFLPGVCYAGLFAGLVLKSLNIVGESYNVHVPGYFQLLLFCVLLIVQITIGAQWLILVAPDLIVVDSIGGYEMLLCRTSLEEIILSLIYQMLLIFLLCILTTVARRTTVVHREEAFLLSVCVGFIVSIWIAWSVLGTIGSRRHNFEDACLAFGLLATCSVILILVFLPRARHLSKLSRNMQHVKFERPNSNLPKTYVVNTNPVSMVSTHLGGLENLSRNALHQSTTSLHSISQFSPTKTMILSPIPRTDDKRGYSGFVQKSPRQSNGQVYIGPQKVSNSSQPVLSSRDMSSAWIEDGTHL